MAPRPTVAFRFTDEDIAIVDAIGQALGLNRTAVLRLAIRMLATKHKIPLPIVISNGFRIPSPIVHADATPTRRREQRWDGLG